MAEIPETVVITEKRKRRWPPGIPQILALILVLIIDSLVSDNFFCTNS